MSNYPVFLLKGLIADAFEKTLAVGTCVKSPATGTVVSTQAIGMFLLMTVGVLIASLYSVVVFASVQGEASLGVSVSDFDYREFDTRGRQLNRENGGLPGFNARGRVFWSNYFAELNLDYTDGEVAYEALINGLPLRTETNEKVLDYSILGGRQWSFSPELMLSSAVGYGERRWERDIQSTSSASGLLEDYYWPYVALRFEASYKLDAQHTLVLGTRWHRTRNAEIQVEFKNRQFDTTTLDLPSGDGYQVFTRWEFQWQPSLILSITPSFESWDMPRSDGFFLSRNGALLNQRVVEPRSETEVFKVLFSIQRRW